VVIEENYENEYEQNWRMTHVYKASSEPHYQIACPTVLPMEEMLGTGQHILKHAATNTSVLLQYNPTLNQIEFWGERDAIFEAARVFQNRMNYLVEVGDESKSIGCVYWFEQNLDQIQKRKTAKKRSEKRAIPKKSDIRREARGAEHSMISAEALSSLSDAPKEYLAVFLLPRPAQGKQFPIHRLLGPREKPLIMLRKELSCYIQYNEEKNEDGKIISAVSFPPYMSILF
jgi:hypothetical protein